MWKPSSGEKERELRKDLEIRDKSMDNLEFGIFFPF